MGLLTLARPIDINPTLFLVPAAVAALAICAVAYTVSAIQWQRRSRGRPLPPGPKTLPYVGNIPHMQKDEVWRAHTELFKIYGDVVHVPVLGSHIVLLGSAEAIVDLLEKRSATTSDREQSPIISLAGQDFNFAFMPHDNKWKQYRRAFAAQFPTNPTKVQKEVQERFTQVFLRKLLEEPEKLLQHIRYTFAASIVKVAYGVEVAESADKNIALMERVVESFQAFLPGRFYVQYLPFLARAPHWLPVVGAQMAQLAVWRRSSWEVRRALFGQTKEDVDRHGTNAPSSCVGDMLRAADEADGEKYRETETLAMNMAVTAFEGAVDTTFATLQFFFMAAARHPAVRAKAQAELDAVVGRGRLPAHSDRAALPYVTAVLKETLRWQNAAPTGIAHMTSEDMEYKGYFIPKGTNLLPVAWAVLHDPVAYPEPERFNPDRFLRDGQLDPTVRDPLDFAVGNGRRKCPGIGFGEAAVWMNIAMALHVFDITPALDEHGREIVGEVKAYGTLVTYPRDCRCTIKPRGAWAEALIRATADL